MHITTTRLITFLAPLSLLLSSTTADHSDNNKKPQIPTCPTTTTTLTPKFHHDSNSQRVKITYGPFSAPSNTSSHHGMAGFKCMPPLPCQDCTITFMQAGLEYHTPDSDSNTPATVETGMSFHHVVFQNAARKDPMCSNRERFFASGDERTPIDLTLSGTRKFGYPLHASDVIVFGLEVMNLLSHSSEIVMTVTYEFIPSLPSSSKNGFHPITPYWFDVGGCTGSGMPAKPNATFTYASPKPVKAPESGYIAFAGAHLHNGGTQLDLLKGGKTCCVGEAVYTNGHITEMGSCQGMAYEEGEEFEIRARYNTERYPAMRHGDGELEPVMGIALVYAVKGYREEKEGGRGKRVGMMLVVVLLAMVVVSGLGYALWRYQRRTDKTLLPAWLRQRIPGLRSVELRGNGRDGEGRLLARDGTAYSDEE